MALSIYRPNIGIEPLVFIIRNVDRTRATLSVATDHHTVLHRHLGSRKHLTLNLMAAALGSFNRI